LQLDVALDLDRCIELLDELVRSEGQVVFRKFWDSGGPGAGAGEEVVYRYRALFWPHSAEGLSGPYDSLEEALEGDAGAITGATRWITCESLPSDQLVESLWVHSAPKNPIEINGEPWQVTSRGELKKC
jgi:hypothetical protein